MSIKAVEWAFKEGPDNTHDLLVLVALAEYADPKGYCFPSIKTLAAKCRMTDRGVQKSVKHLVAEGYLEVETGGWKEGSNRYRLVKRARERGEPGSGGRGEPGSPGEQHSPPNDIHQGVNPVPPGGEPGSDEPVIEPVIEPSAPNGADAGGVVIPFAKKVFDLGVACLGDSGVSPRQARELVGKWRKEAGDAETFSALLEAQRQGITEPVAWITARLKPQPAIDTASIVAAALADLNAKEASK